MSIQDKLKDTQKYLRSTRRAILGRGGEIAENAGLDAVASAISAIPTDTSLAYYTDDSVVYEKIVPSGVEDYVQVAKVGGMTYKTRNLIPFPYRETTVVRNGITWTVNEDGTIIANGTAEAGSSFGIYHSASELIKGNTYTFSGMTAQGSLSSFYMSYYLYDIDSNYVEGATLIDKEKSFVVPADTVQISSFLYVVAGATVNNVVFKPMLNEGSIALPYEKYFEGLRDTKVTALISEGTNLFDINRTDYVSCDEYALSKTPKIENGILYSGGTHGHSRGAGIPIYLKPNTKYSFSCYAESNDENMYVLLYFVNNIVKNIYDESTEKAVYVGSKSGFMSITFDSENYQAVVLTTYSTNRYGIAITDIMLNEGTVALPYRPFFKGSRDTNLIPFPYETPSGTYNGVTFTVQDDGGVKIKGASTDSIPFTLARNLNISVQRYVTASGSQTSAIVNVRRRTADGRDLSWMDSANGVPTTGYLEEGEKLSSIGIYIPANSVVDTVVYPMCHYGTTALPYKPYGKDLNGWENLIPLMTETATINGIIYTPQEDGSLVLNGTANETSVCILWDYGSSKIHLNKGETYTLSGCSEESGNVYLTIQDTSYNQTIFNRYGNTQTFTAEYDTYYSYIVVLKGFTADNLVIKPMLNRGTTAMPYRPYGANTVDILPISAELREFLEDKGYGRGVEGYPNYIDYERKVFVQNTYYKVCDGKEPWGAYSTNTEGKYRILLATPNIPAPVKIDSAYISPIICNHYDTITGNKVFTCNRGCNCAGTFIAFYDEAYNANDISLWKTHLAQLYTNGNPLIVEYALAEPIETDISQYLTNNDNFFAVEGGGTIRAENEYNYAAPTTINYLTKTEG